MNDILKIMKLNKNILKLKFILGGVILLFVLNEVSMIYALYHSRKLENMAILIDELEKSNYYNRLAGSIADHYNSVGNRIKFADVKKILISIDKLVPKYFPEESPFSCDDLTAIAAVESIFNPKAVGTLGERGTFQIWKWKEGLINIGHKGKDPFDIELNTEMALWLLKYKYKIFKDRKKTIIGYNGCETYWDKFLIAENRVRKWKELAKKL